MQLCVCPCDNDTVSSGELISIHIKLYSRDISLSLTAEIMGVYSISGRAGVYSMSGRVGDDLMQLIL